MRKNFSEIEPGTLVTADQLNDNFSNLEDVINTVDNTQLRSSGITWDTVNKTVSGVSVGGVSYHPLIAAIKTSSARVNDGNTSVLLSATSAANLVDDSAVSFEISFDDTSGAVDFAFVDGDCIRYWFSGQIMVYNPGAATALDDAILIYPEFKFYTLGVAGPWNSYWPSTADPEDLITPHIKIGCAISGTTLYSTTRTAGYTGRGPGLTRNVSMEGVFPIINDVTTRVDIRLMYETVGTNAATLRADLNAANFQAILLKQCYEELS